MNHRSNPIWELQSLRFIFIFATLFIYIQASLAFTNSPNKKIENFDSIKKKLDSLVKEKSPFNEFEIPPTTKLSKEKIIKITSNYYAIPITISFSGLANHYCRLAIVRSDTAYLVGLPRNIDSDACEIKSAIHLSLGKRRLSAIVVGFSIPSNRYEGRVTLQQAYILDAHDRYCYSTKLSNILDYPWDGTEISANSIISKEKNLRNEDVLTCSTE